MGDDDSGGFAFGDSVPPPIKAPLKIPEKTEKPERRYELYFCYAPFNMGTARNTGNYLKHLAVGAQTIHVEIYNPQDGKSLWVEDEIVVLSYKERPSFYTSDWAFFVAELTKDEYDRFMLFVHDRTVEHTYRIDDSSIMWYPVYCISDFMAPYRTTCSRSVAEVIVEIWGIQARGCMAAVTPDCTRTMLEYVKMARPDAKVRKAPLPPMIYDVQ